MGNGYGKWVGERESSDERERKEKGGLENLQYTFPSSDTTTISTAARMKAVTSRKKPTLSVRGRREGGQ